MLYLFHGSDADKARTKAFAWVAAARAKEPNLAYLRFSADELSKNGLVSASESGGLFVKRLLVLVDDPYATPVSAGTFEEALPRLAGSDNAFVVLAPHLLAARAKKVEKHATKTYVFDQRVSRETRGFNSALVHALASRSRETLWLEIARAHRAGDAPEMLHGLLAWKARDLMQKPTRAWPPEDSRALSFGLITLLVESRRKGLDLSLELERWALLI